jgi:hypothetical protein
VGQINVFLSLAIVDVFTEWFQSWGY